MSVSRQRKLQIELRQRQVAELTLKGHRQVDIAAKLGATQPTVSYDLKKIRATWREATRHDFEASLSEQRESLALIQREAWEGWERSKQPARTAVFQGAGEGEPTKTRQTLKHQNGDPRFLEQVQRCLAALGALLDLGARRERAAEPPAKRVMTLADILPHMGKPRVPYSNVVDGAEEYERLMQERMREDEEDERQSG